MVALEVLYFVLLIVTCGLLGMIETSIISARKGRLLSAAEEGDREAKDALKIAESPDLALASIRAVLTFVTVLTVMVGAETLGTVFARFLISQGIFSHFGRGVGAILIVLLISYLLLIFGQVVPRRIARTYPERILTTFAKSLGILSRLMLPITKILGTSSGVVQKLFGATRAIEEEVIEDEIRDLMSKGSEAGVIEKTEERIVSKVFRLGDRPANSIMTPRQDIVWLDVNDSIDKVWQEVKASEYSYYPIADKTIESIVGVVTVKDLAELIKQGSHAALRSIAREPLRIPSNLSALRVLEIFKENKKHFALVIDEYGSVDGLITMHDLMEAIVGDLADSEDAEPEYKRRGDGSYVVDAAMDLHDLFSLLELPSYAHDDHQGYHSVGGFIMKNLGHLPSVGERFEFSGFQFEVTDMDRHRVDRVQVRKVSHARASNQ